VKTERMSIVAVTATVQIRLSQNCAKTPSDWVP
jgi:hypothetical protein